MTHIWQYRALRPCPTFAFQQFAQCLPDKLQPLLERAVYFTEYVIRHGGARHLRSPELDLSWIQLLHLDILLVLHLVLFILYETERKLTTVCC